MKTRKEILEAVRSGNAWERESCGMFDCRDYSRIADYFPVSDWDVFGFSLKEGATHKPKRYTEKNILKHMASSLDFAFEKATGQRGISSSLMWDVMKMWAWILEDDELTKFTNYDPYGIPFYKAFAEKYNLPDKS